MSQGKRDSEFISLSRLFYGTENNLPQKHVSSSLNIEICSFKDDYLIVPYLLQGILS